MRLQQLGRASLLLLVGVAGCSSTSSSKLASKNPARSIPVVGDRSMPASVGEPGEQLAAEIVEPEPKRNPLARISGRVLDDRGRPVPDAVVRLADGGQQGGRDSRTTTDRSGAFTLGGLRTGADYVIVAESDGDGTTLTGRARARTADTGVTISLGASDEESTPVRRPRTRPISRRESVDDADEPGASPRVNREDLNPSPADDDRPIARTATSGTAILSAPISSAGWRKPGTAAKSPARVDADGDAPLELPPEPSRPKRRPPADDLAPDEDGPDPLPPAIEHPPAAGGKSQAARSRQEAEPEPGALSLAPDTTPEPARRPAKDDTAQAMMAMPTVAAEEPPPAPEAALVVEAGKSESLEPDPSSLRDLPIASTGPAVATSAAPPPSATAVPDESKENPASRPVFASQGAAEPASNAAYDPFALVAASAIAAPEVTPSSLGPDEPSEAPTPAPLPAPKKWGDLADKDRPKIVVEPTKASSGLLRRLRGGSTPPAAKAGPVMLCDYDARHRKVADFQLPDLEGKPVRLHDLEAEYVLLDFWGTWCKPCLDSIPHLVELQKKYGRSKLQVVGIACEQESEKEKAARVGEFARRLGINYTILLSTMDGTCPLQNALQVQYYPTMVLLDRKGQVIWRDRGATEATLARLDKVLDSRSAASVARR